MPKPSKATTAPDQTVNPLAVATDLPASVRKAEAALVDMRRFAAKVCADHGLTPNEFVSVLAALTINSFNEPSPPPPALPTEAPELWAKRDLNMRETASDFTQRVYAPWLGRNLSRKDVARLDPELYKALSVWLTRHPNDEITKALPSQSDQIDEVIERLSAQYPVEVLRKLGYAIDTRMRRQKK